LLALVVAATLAPLWDYGFEVRHDNLVLTGVLLTWWAVRVKPMGVASYVFSGATAVALLFIAVKSVVYVIPISLAILAFPPPSYTNSRWRLGLAWLLGAVFATLLTRIAYGTGGGWEIYLSVFHGVARYSAGEGRGNSGFAPWSTLGRLLGQTPLLLAITTAAAFSVAADLFRRGKAVLTWHSHLPELLVVLGALCALAVNPTPFAYNLVHVVPYAFVFVFRYMASIWDDIWSQIHFRPLVIGILIFAHLVPFGIATRRHLDHLNWRQERLMSLAEDLTDPKCDPVYDGIGMVPTRPSIHYQWLLHSLNIQNFLKGPGPRVREMLAARPAAVIIPSYRTDWLSDEDRDFMQERYVPLADDFWVLGKVLSPGGGTFEIFHPGRYRISTLKGSDLDGTYPTGWEGLTTPEDKGTLSGTLDGVPLTGRPVELAVGKHRIETSAESLPAVVWIGPHLDRIHRINPGNHRVLFYNWY
jgi:hypothetical protein